MVDFTKRLGAKQVQRPTDPVALYDTLDRAHDKGPLRPAQTAILREWHEERRKKKDTIIKLHTGQGKTLIGLLILQSKLNEKPDPAIYLCPNNYLVDQTCAQAKQFGFRYCKADGDLPDDFYNGKSLLITSVQKMFNGRSKFNIGQQSSAVPYIVMDDAHACIDAIKDAFRIRFSKEDEAYRKIVDLFSDALSSQGAGTFAEIKNGNADSLLPVPYWDWQEKHVEIVKILAEAVRIEDEKKKNRKDIWFVWPLVRDMIQDCQCYVSGHALEITPFLPPLELFGSFCKAEHRVFMSATVTNDAFLVKGLRLSVETITRPLVFKEERWSGEKMILIPSLIHESLNRSAIVAEWGKRRSGRDHGVVALVPSFRLTADWEKYGARIAKKESIRMDIERLRDGQFDEPIVIVNRYDGIDLPDSMCRILIFDSKPYSEVLSDLYEENCRATSEITAVRTARVIEQGLGRSVRGEKDYSIIIVVGTELVKFVRNTASRKYLSSQTRGQVEIGLQVAEMAEQEIKVGATPTGAIHSLIAQCLGRDDGWKGFYIQEMNTIVIEQPSTAILDVFKRELAAELFFQQGETQRAVSELQNMADTLVTDAADKCWYLQEMARYTFRSSKVDSNKYQVAAHRGNRYLMKPRTGVEFTRLQAISQKQVETIIKWVTAQQTYEQLALAVDEIVSRLEFGVKAEKFEQAFKDLGSCLGFSSERPDKEWKEGPDNLWCIRNGQYMIVECKSEVDLNRAEMNKDETGQMNNACAWFDRNYQGAVSTNVLLIPTNKLGKAAGFNKDVKVMRDKELRKLRWNVKAFFSEFKTADLANLSESKVQEFLDNHHLSADAILGDYVQAVRS